MCGWLGGLRPARSVVGAADWPLLLCNSLSWGGTIDTPRSTRRARTRLPLAREPLAVGGSRYSPNIETAPGARPPITAHITSQLDAGAQAASQPFFYFCRPSGEALVMDLQIMATACAGGKPGWPSDRTGRKMRHGYAGMACCAYAICSNPIVFPIQRSEEEPTECKPKATRPSSCCTGPSAWAAGSDTLPPWPAIPNQG